MGTCWQPISTSVIDELQESSIAVIKVQRIRDIRVFAVKFIKSPPGFGVVLQCRRGLNKSESQRGSTTEVYRQREISFKARFSGIESFFVQRTCKNGRFGELAAVFEGRKTLQVRFAGPVDSQRLEISLHWDTTVADTINVADQSNSGNCR